MAEENSMSQKVIAGLGGPSNIGGVENCITRLRIPVARESDVDLEGLRAIDGVLGVVPGPTMQVVLGPGVVDTVARDIEKSLATSSSTAEESAPTTKSSNSAAADDGPSSPNDLQALGARMKSAL